MNSQPLKILIIGNGFGGTYALKHLYKLFSKDKSVQLSIVGDKNYFLFTPLLHEVATGGISPDHIIEPIRKVLGHCLHEFYLGKVEMVNLTDNTAKVGEEIIPFDYLVLAPGSETNFYNIPGAAEHSLSLKSLDDANKIKKCLISQMERASHMTDKLEIERTLRFVIVGGGPSGVELAAEIEELIRESFSFYYKKNLIKEASVVIVERGSALVPMFGEKLSRKSLDVLTKKGVKVMLNTAVKEINSSEVLLEDGNSIQTENVFWLAGVKPAEIKFDTQVERSPDGKLAVNEYMEVLEVSRPNCRVFAIGDIASFKDKSGKPLPALAQVAEKQAKALATNIYLMSKGKPMTPFTYRHTGTLMSIGREMAVGEISNITFSGRIAWWVWKTVYLSKLISPRKKAKVVVDWLLNIASPRDISI